MAKGKLTSVGVQLSGSIHESESDDLEGRLPTTIPKEQLPWAMLIPRPGFLLPSHILLALPRDTTLITPVAKKRLRHLSAH
jgi:hypothetical protein